MFPFAAMSQQLTSSLHTLSCISWLLWVSPTSRRSSAWFRFFRSAYLPYSCGLLSRKEHRLRLQKWVPAVGWTLPNSASHQAIYLAPNLRTFPLIVCLNQNISKVFY
jgi:hypothetical protein